MARRPVFRIFGSYAQVLRWCPRGRGLGTETVRSGENPALGVWDQITSRPLTSAVTSNRPPMISAEHANGLTWNNIWLTAAIDEQHTDPGGRSVSGYEDRDIRRSTSAFSWQWAYPGDRPRRLRPGLGRSEFQTELLFERCVEVREFVVGGLNGSARALWTRN